jgi:hypothetical protein
MQKSGMKRKDTSASRQIKEEKIENKRNDSDNKTVEKR